MKVRPLIIDASARAQAAALTAYAKENVMDSRALVNLSAIKDQRLAVGLNPLTRMTLQFGYRVVYSLEQQPVQGLCHHVSVSVDEPGWKKGGKVLPKVLPSEEAVNMILELFGIKKPVHKCLFIWVEDIDDGGGGAINIIDKVEEEHDRPTET